MVAEQGKALAIASSVSVFVKYELSAKPRWEKLNFPVIGRGAHAIIPLVAVVHTADRSSEDEQFLTELHQELQLHWGYHYGDRYSQLRLLDTDEGYGFKLAKNGKLLRQPNQWTSGHYCIVVVRSIDESETFDTLALHAVPAEWVNYNRPNMSTKRALSRYRRIMGKRDEAKVTWTWPLEASES